MNSQASKRRENRFGGMSGAALATLALLVALAVVFPGTASSSAAEPSRIGPIDPETKLPGWIEDETGLRLKPCPVRSGCPASDASAGERVTYWSATATVPTNGGGSAVLALSTQGSARPSGKPATYEQQVSSRIRISADNLEPGATYEVAHPYGTETFTNVNGGRRGIDFTEDVGCLQAPCDDFSAALNGRVDPWLTWDTLGASRGAPPEGYIGVASTLHKVHGSTVIDENGEPQNYFEIKGPNVGGPGIDTVRTRLFAVEGRISGLTAFANPKSGSYDTGQSITLTASDPAGEIFYTTDGTEPTADSIPYRRPISITEQTTLKFIVIVPDEPAGKLRRSPVRTANYTINHMGLS